MLSRDRQTHELARGSAGFEDIRIHDRLHSYAVEAAESAVDQPMIRWLLGRHEIETAVHFEHHAPGFLCYAENQAPNSIAEVILHLSAYATAVQN